MYTSRYPIHQPIHHTPAYTPYTSLYTIHQPIHHTPACTPYTSLYTIHQPIHHTPAYTPYTSLYTIHQPIHHTPACTPYTSLYTLHHPIHHTLAIPYISLYTIHVHVHQPISHTPAYTPYTSLYTIHQPIHHTSAYTPYQLIHHTPAYTPYTSLYTVPQPIYHTPAYTPYTIHQPIHHTPAYTPYTSLYTIHQPIHHTPAYTPYPSLYTIHQRIHHTPAYTPYTSLYTIHQPVHHAPAYTPYTSLYTIHQPVHHTDDGVLAGDTAALVKAVHLLDTYGSTKGLLLNPSKCQLYGPCDPTRFHCSIPHQSALNFDILGAPIGDDDFCASFIEKRLLSACELLSLLPKLCDPQLSLGILRQCASFCKLAHLARCTPPTSAVLELLANFDNDVLHCLEQCTELQLTPMASRQAQLSFRHGGFGLRSLFSHATAAFIASASISLSGAFLHPPPNSHIYSLLLQCLISRSPKEKL